MNSESETSELFLSWQGQVTGPHTLREVGNLLKLGKIHSLYKIQVEGQWFLLRDHIAALEKRARDGAARQAVAGTRLHEPQVSAIVEPLIVPDDDFLEENIRRHEIADADGNGEEQGSVPTGLAISCFVLSLFFFVPFINGITWLLALIFGHLAISGESRNSSGRMAILARVGLWITYVQIGFFLTGLAWASITEVLPMMAAYALLHWMMFGNGIFALIGAGVLMLAVKLASGHLIRFSPCFLGALIPSTLGNLGLFFLLDAIAGGQVTDGRNLVMIGTVHLILFVGQIFFWARFIRLPDGEELGISRAAVTSMLYTVVFVFVGFGYAAVIAILSS